MNKDQAKGMIKDATGTVQETTGRVIGSNEAQLEGISKHVDGHAQRCSTTSRHRSRPGLPL
jgi:uncharacterized protein YjbJ (UPF0337 family)